MLILILYTTALISPILWILIMMINKGTNRRANIAKNPPGPVGLPFIGNLHQFDSAKPHVYLWELSKKYGPLTYLKHGSTAILVVNSTKMALEVLKSHDLSFCSRPSVVGQKKLAYEGIDIAFSSYNHHWRNMKKLCVLHLFSPKQVLMFRPVREDEVSRMITKISNFSSSNLPMNLSELAMSVACNFICRVAFGRRYDDDEYDKIRFDRLIMEAQALMVSFYFSDHFPTFGYWIDRLSGLLSRLDKNCKELDVFYQQLIDEHVDPSRPKLPETSLDIIDLMIQLKDQKSSSIDLTWDHIKALLMDLIVAGTDTVAASIVWAMTALMSNPSIMKKVQLEIRQFIGANRRVHEDDIEKLPFLKAVVLESLRMYPPAPLIYRTLIAQDTCLIDGHHEIRPGTSVIVNGWAMARDPDIWENPDAFLPERFLVSRGTNSTDHDNENNEVMRVLFDNNLKMIPFGGGRRRCPGMGMGLISIELTLANLLYAFDWTLPDGAQDIEFDSLPGLTMHKKIPLVLMPSPNYSYCARF